MEEPGIELATFRLQVNLLYLLSSDRLTPFPLIQTVLPSTTQFITFIILQMQHHAIDKYINLHVALTGGTGRTSQLFEAKGLCFIIVMVKHTHTVWLWCNQTSAHTHIYTNYRHPQKCNHHTYLHTV